MIAFTESGVAGGDHSTQVKLPEAQKEGSP